jgi:hypothetical protein
MGKTVFKNKTKTKVTIVLAILSIAYCASAACALIMAYNIFNAAPDAHLSLETLLIYTIGSLTWATILSVYFLFNAVGRRRRREDGSKD